MTRFLLVLAPCVGLLLGTDMSAVIFAEEPPAAEAPSAPAVRRDTNPQEPQAKDGCCDPEATRRGEETYREISEATGGLSFDGGMEHFGEALNVMMDLDGPEVYTLARVKGRASSATPVIVPVLVDGTVRSADFVISFPKKESVRLHVRRPDGSTTREGEPGVGLIEIPALKRVRVAEPTVGTWTMMIGGEGRFEATVTGKTKIAFVGMSFERPIPSDYHPSAQDVGSTLLLGEMVYFDASLFGDVANPAFDLISVEGRSLESLRLHPDAVYGYGGEYTPRTLHDPFLVRATGTDGSGNRFQRVIRRHFAVRPFVVRPDPLHPKVGGNPPRFRFEVMNAGEAARFVVSAETLQKLPVNLTPSELDLAKEGHAFVEVEVHVGDGALTRRDELIVTVARANDPNVIETASVSLSKGESDKSVPPER
jgi:hypothetical protein